MPLIEIHCRKGPPSPTTLPRLVEVVAGALQVPKDAVRIRWEEASSGGFVGPSEGQDPVVNIFLKSRPSEALTQLFERLADFLTVEIRCVRSNILIMAIPVDPGYLMTRGAVWHG